jgi:uncharacterized membrane protein YdjX (TVP38/TMEM64 family)
MSLEVGVLKRKLPVAKLAIVAIAAIAAAVLLARGIDPRALLEQLMKMIRDAGPWVFFIAMAILPAFGLPMMLFTIPAGEAFAPRLGMPAVIAISLVVIAINLALGYWVARYALRPVLTGVLKRYGYSIPRVTPENALSITLLVRLTPGPPYALQGFILGCAEVPFRMYMIVAWLGVLPWAIGAIILGRGLFSGNFGTALSGLGVLVAAAAAIHWMRRKYFRRVS